MKKNWLLLCLCIFMLAVTLISCGEPDSNNKPVKYPDSVYGDAKFGEDKFN